jgi:hypothetical protein
MEARRPACAESFVALQHVRDARVHMNYFDTAANSGECINP